MLYIWRGHDYKCRECNRYYITIQRDFPLFRIRSNFCYGYTCNDCREHSSYVRSSYVLGWLGCSQGAIDIGLRRWGLCLLSLCMCLCLCLCPCISRTESLSLLVPPITPSPPHRMCIPRMCISNSINRFPYYYMCELYGNTDVIRFRPFRALCRTAPVPSVCVCICDVCVYMLCAYMGCGCIWVVL